MADENKPCPFCGGSHINIADASEDLTDECGYAVTCLQCGAFGPLGATSAEAQAKWDAATVPPDRLVLAIVKILLDAQPVYRRALLSDLQRCDRVRRGV